jgi:HSP20 family protein
LAKVKWIPFKDLLFLQERMSRVFGDAVSRYRGLGGSSKVAWSPPADIYETDDSIVLKVELPGVDIKNVKVEIKENVLTLSGERRFTKNLKEEHFHRMESCYGTFLREFNLPKVVDEKGIKANLKDGVLEIRVPKTRKSKRKHIKVEVK